MTRRPGDKTPEPPGGRAAQRLRMFEEARGRPPAPTPDPPSAKGRPTTARKKSTTRRKER